DPGAGAVPEPPAALAPPGRGGDGVLARRRHSDGDHRGGAGQPMVGQRREDLRAARAVDAVVLGRAAHDPLLLRLPRLAPLVRVGHPLHLVMPAIALGWVFAAAHMRLTRSSMLEVLGSEYVKLARLKGLPEALVISKHAFKNALIPVLTLAGINLVIMVNVAVVVETGF